MYVPGLSFPPPRLFSLSLVFFLLSPVSSPSPHRNPNAQTLKTPFLTPKPKGFADRHFYSDWWNSCDWLEFSREWNIPVHHFFRRHVYTASRAVVSRPIATLVTFVISALAHELVMGCITKKLRGYGAAALLLQMPIVLVQRSRWMKGRRLLNVSCLPLADENGSFTDGVGCAEYSVLVLDDFWTGYRTSSPSLKYSPNIISLGQLTHVSSSHRCAHSTYSSSHPTFGILMKHTWFSRFCIFGSTSRYP